MFNRFAAEYGMVPLFVGCILGCILTGLALGAAVNGNPPMAWQLIGAAFTALGTLTGSVRFVDFLSTRG